MSGIKYIFHTLHKLFSKNNFHIKGNKDIFNLRCKLCSISQLLSPAAMTSQHRQGTGSRRAHPCSAPKAVALQVIDPQHHIGVRGGRQSCPKVQGKEFTAPSRRDTSDTVPGCTPEGTEWPQGMCFTCRSPVSVPAPPHVRVSPATAPKASCSLAADPALAGRATSHQ